MSDKPFKDSENSGQFEDRKRSHIELALHSRNQAIGLTGFDRIQLLHEALPELNLEDVDISTEVLGRKMATPFLISSMTAGHVDGRKLNLLFARQAAERGWLFGVGSQRRELSDEDLASEWRSIRKEVPNLVALSNIGLSQLIQTPVDRIKDLALGLEASAMIVHLNALQEALQPEGTPSFSQGLQAIANLVQELGLPVIVKETGCGFSADTLRRLSETGVYAVDVSGLGGTHWGRIEGDRARSKDDRSAKVRARAAGAFADWGMGTVESTLAAVELNPRYRVWASGGVRSGVDAAKLFALGAQIVGIAKPLLAAAMQDEDELSLVMETLEFELRTSFFCTGAGNLRVFQGKKVWKWK